MSRNNDPFGPCPACHQWQCKSWARGAGAPCGPVWDRGTQSDGTPELDKMLAEAGIEDPLTRGLTKMGIAVTFRVMGQGIPAPLDRSGREDMKKGIAGLRAELGAALFGRRPKQ